MTGRIDAVRADPGEAGWRLAQAERHVASANAQGIDAESASILLYSAMQKALSAVLLVAGRRVRPGERAHAILIEEAGRQLGEGHADLMRRVDRARRKRNHVAYETEEIGASELRSLRTAAVETIDATRAFVEKRRP